MVKTMIKKTAEDGASNYPVQLGTSSLVQYTQDGTTIAPEDVVIPYQVIYEPNRETFPRDPDSNDFLEYFTSWEPSVVDGEPEYPVLFNVKARDDPGSELVKIGEVRLKSTFHRSHWGDRKLFFRHEPFEEDLRFLRKIGDDARAQSWYDASQFRAYREEDFVGGFTELIPLPDNN